MIITTKSLVASDGSMYVLAYVGAEKKPAKFGHDYETYLDSEEAHVRVARTLFRFRAVKRGEADVAGTISRGVAVRSYKLPDSCNHDWCHVVTYADEVGK